MLGTGIIGPILPLYAETFGVSYSIVGLMISAFGFGRIITDMPAGSLSDRWGRKPLFLLGMVVYGASALMAAYAGDISHLILSRFFQGVGGALLTTTGMAIVSDIAGPNERGKYVSYYQASFFLGTMIGPAIGGYLTEVGGFRAPFFALAALALSSAVFSQVMISESLPKATQAIMSVAEMGKFVKTTLLNRNMLVLEYSAAALFALNAGIRLTSLPLYGERIANLSPSEIGIVLTVAAFSGLLILPWVGSSIDKHGAKPHLVLGFLIAAASTYAFILSTNLFVISAVAAVLGLSSGLANPAQASAVIKEADSKHRGSSVGAYRVFSDIGVTTGPIIAGLSADRFGLLAPFVVISLLCILTSIIAQKFLK